MMTNTKKYFVKRMITAIHVLLLVMLLTVPVYAEAVDMPVIGVSEISNEDMTFALSFQLEQATEEQLSAYGSWLADFEVEFNHDITLNSAGTADGYLSGQLDIVGDEWIDIPSTERLLSANEPMKTAEAAVKQKGMSSLVKLTLLIAACISHRSMSLQILIWWLLLQHASIIRMILRRALRSVSLMYIQLDRMKPPPQKSSPTAC